MTDYAADAEDIVQEVMLRIITSTAVPKVISNAWLRTVCTRCVFNARRKLKQERLGFVCSEDRYGFVYERDDEERCLYVAEDSVDEGHKVDALSAWKQLMDRLNSQQRRVLVLSALGASYVEIAVLMKSSVGTVRSRLHYARKEAKALWQETPYA